jgi:hypothetical protein
MCFLEKNYRSKEETECRRTKSSSFYKFPNKDKQSDENNKKFFPQTRVTTPIKYRLFSSKDDHHSISILNFKKEEDAGKKKKTQKYIIFKIEK